MTPEEFTRVFAGAFGRHDAGALADLLAADAEVLTLTGASVSGPEAAEAAFAAEFAGTFATSRLVTGKLKLRDLGSAVAIITQKFVVSGARDEAGAELPRFGAVLTAVLVDGAASPETGWRAVNLSLSATT